MKKSGTIIEIPLTKAEFGISLILDNVLEFVKETRILLDKSRTTHARGLLELAIQELGKAKLLKRGFHEQTQILTDNVKLGQKLTLRNVPIEGLFDAEKKHDSGISLLQKEAREIADQALPGSRSDSSLNKNPKDSEPWFVKSFLVNWEDGEWSLPSPARVFAGFDPPKELLVQLGILTEAIEEATKQLIAE